MNDFEQLIQAMHEIPPELVAVLNTRFGTVDELEMPKTVEESLIVQGKVAVNFNNKILKPLSNVPIIQLALRIGQNNPTVHGMLLSMLKMTGSLGKDAISCNIQDGGSYGVGELPITVTLSRGSASAVTGALAGPENQDVDFDKPGEAQTWTATPTIGTAGEYTLTITVTFTDAGEPKTVTFNITIEG